MQRSPPCTKKKIKMPPCLPLQLIADLFSWMVEKNEKYWYFGSGGKSQNSPSEFRTKPEKMTLK